MRRVGTAILAAGAMFGLALIGDGRSSGQDKIAPKAEAQDKPAPRAAAAVADAEEAQIKRFEQSYGQYLKRMHQAELQFVQVVAEPTKPQHDKIAAEGDAVVKSTARSLALAARGRGGIQNIDPRALIAEAVAKSVKANLSPEQAARYEKETALRTAARKRLAVKNLVAMIDQVLILRPEQRDKIGEVLSANWDNSWNQTQLFMYGGQYFPALPDAKIVPLLSEPQKTVWRGIPKGNVNFGINWGGGFFAGEEVDVMEAGEAVIEVPDR